MGPLQSPKRKPITPGWGQFFRQDHWSSHQSQGQNFCVPPGLASPPVQMNCREQTLQSTFLENHGKDRERREKHSKEWTEKERDIADTKWTYGLIDAQSGDIFCQIFIEGWFAQLQPEATLTAHWNMAGKLHSSSKSHPSLPLPKYQWSCQYIQCRKLFQTSFPYKLVPLYTGRESTLYATYALKTKCTILLFGHWSLLSTLSTLNKWAWTAPLPSEEDEQ